MRGFLHCLLFYPSFAHTQADLSLFWWHVAQWIKRLPADLAVPSSISDGDRNPFNRKRVSVA